MENVKLYYIAQEYIQEDGEFVHLYSHEVCTEEEAKDYLKIWRREVIKQQNIPENNFIREWYEEIKILNGDYEIVLTER